MTVCMPVLMEWRAHALKFVLNVDKSACCTLIIAIFAEELRRNVVLLKY